MFFVATREVVLVVHTNTALRTHGLIFDVIDDHGVKTGIDTSNHRAPPKKHDIIRNFK